MVQASCLRSVTREAGRLHHKFAARPAPATAAELAKSFKGAKTDRVAELLTTLASLGQARPAGDARYAA